MAIRNIPGKLMGLYINNVLVGCIQDVSLSINREEVETTCRASGDAKEFTQGDYDWSGSASGALRVATAGDAATNFTFENLVDAILAGTTFDVTVGTETVGDPVYSGSAFFTSAEITGSRTDATFSGSFRGTGELAKTINA